ncbi:hypothetical protein WICMUC_005195 [Wickerhamomyces mucosus]|uniref:Transcriptional regulatory protein SDS3 n=1 Tax=Wickerhamomyces mucosus TaxID=1378264 RepID=A0A9P8PA44_9ASCO|nr:hypothetical protein WICMUC_005195 [Wickerhamomyces mucosus]
MDHQSSAHNGASYGYSQQQQQQQQKQQQQHYKQYNTQQPQQANLQHHTHFDDKKRATVQAKLNKIEESFQYERDYHYKTMLQNLQKELSSVHNNSNEDLATNNRDLEEIRDFELVKLRLYEKFEANRAIHDYEDEVAKANKEHEEMMKLVQEKLNLRLEHQIKKLKEDKALLDVANSHSYNIIDSSDFHKNTRSSTHNHNNSGTIDSGINSLNGFMGDRRGLRRRGAGDYYSTQNEDSANDSSKNNGYTSSGNKKKISNHRGSASANNGMSSNDESFFSDTNKDLSSLLFGEKKENNKTSTRGSSKAYIAPSGLKNEEINDDIALLKSLKT